jgi:ABC-type sugar transport system permease subunit
MATGGHRIRLRGESGRELITAVIFLLPYLLVFIVWQIVPFFYGLFISFTNYNLLHLDQLRFVGFENYAKIFTDEMAGTALINTIYYVGGLVIIGFFLALLLAISMNSARFGSRFLKWVCFIPTIMTVSATGIVWGRIYAGQYGILNQVLKGVGLPALAWLQNTHTAMPAVILVGVWVGVGYWALILMAGLQNIPKELYEAAMIDGAGRWEQLFSITLPLLRPIIFFVLTIIIIESFQVFALVTVLTSQWGDIYGGNPGYHTLTMVILIYGHAFKLLDMGYGAALSWLLFLIIMVVTVLQIKFIGFGWEE